MDLDQDDDELSALQFARHYGLCTPYDKDPPTIGNLSAPYIDNFDQDLGDPSMASLTNKISTLIKERLTVSKEAALLLKSILDLLEAPSIESQLTERRKWTQSLRQELPLLRTDNDLDLLNFGNVVMPDFKYLKIPYEVVNEANDEGFKWPARYPAYPVQCDAQIKAEKLAVSKDVLFYLQDAIRDPYGSEDFEDCEKLNADSMNYKLNTTHRPVTPPLLPLSPPLFPYIPSSPANRLPLPSDSSDGVTLEAKSLELQIMGGDSLTCKSSDSDDSMLLDIASPLPIGPLFERQQSAILKRRTEDLKVEGPLTPPMFSTSPLKKLKSVSFKDILYEFIPEAPLVSSAVENNGDELECDTDRDLEDLRPIAQLVRRRVENEKLIGADTTVRMGVPDADFTLPVAPWNEYSQRNSGKHQLGLIEIDAQMKFLLRIKREDLKTASSWHGVSSLERSLHWGIFTAEISKINLDEKLHGETELNKMLADTTTGTVANSSSQVWKPDGLRLLDEGLDEEEIHLAETQERKDVEGLIRKRKLEMEEEEAEAQSKRTYSQPASHGHAHHRSVPGSDHRSGELAVAPTAATHLSGTVQHEERRSQSSLARQKSTRTSKEAASDLMFGGFSATSALHKFMETRGKDVRYENTKLIDASYPSQKATAPMETIVPVRSREVSLDHAGFAAQQEVARVVKKEGNNGIASALRSPLPPVPKDLSPCCFIMSSTFLKQRSMMKLVEQLYPGAEIVYRDYDLPHSQAKEADMIMSPSTGLALTTLQQIKQCPLPGQPDRSPIKERIDRLQLRYERLLVLVGEGLSREMESQTLDRPHDPQSAAALTRLESFAEQLEGNVVIKYVSGGEEALARTIVIEMAKYGLPHGSRDIGDNKPLAVETTWEVFLRRAGLNPFAAQVVVASLKDPYDVPLPMWAGSPTSSDRPASVSVFGLQAFLTMGEEQRVKEFQALMGGSRILRKASKVLDQEWPSAAHGFRM